MKVEQIFFSRLQLILTAVAFNFNNNYFHNTELVIIRNRGVQSTLLGHS